MDRESRERLIERGWERKRRWRDGERLRVRER